MRACLVALLTVLSLAIHPAAAFADWRCDGDRVTIRSIPGAVDVRGLKGGIPDTASGTVPGDGILLTWRDVSLQLPRTNNAGTPSYTDGRWWWRADDPQHPEFKQRQGTVISYRCDAID